ncbi:MAG: TRAP transporter permease [Deltaproteobacteria bacterium]|nr:TRAP transporter permease [Deltaproteobacteria bacterium]
MSMAQEHSLGAAIVSNREKAAFVVCLCMSLFQMYSAGIGLLQTPVQRSIHLTFVLAIIFLMYPSRFRGGTFIDMLFLAGSLVGAGYIALFSDAIAMRGGKPMPHEMVLGIITMVAVFEAGRRVLGKALPILALVFLGYCFIGRYAPMMFAHRGYSLERVVQHMYLTTEGIFGIALGVSSTYVFMFILFGSFLSGGGGASLFNNIALSLTGRMAGGPAKVAVIASGLLGTISGSSIATVVTSGSFTIPMMRKAGFTAEESAGITACASTGGQFMPPIMGAGAFIMSEFLNVSYGLVALSATIPALLYYGAVFLNVHFMAKRYNMKGTDTNVEKIGAILRKDGHLLLPLVLIVAMLIMHYTPLKSAFWAIIAMVCICALKRRTRMGIFQIGDALADGARNAIGTAIACAVVGYIVGSFSLTGLGLKFSINIMELTGGSLFLTLAMAMVACLVLGMGLPTTANYIVTSTIVVPVLVKMGVVGISAHLFVYYFGIMADITPPVCLASFTAAGLANADATRTGLKAFYFALPSFFLPYLFIYSPEILLQSATVWNVSLVILRAFLGIAALAAALNGWLFRPLPVIARPLLFVSGVGCYSMFPPLQVAGGGIIALVIVTMFFTRNRAGAMPMERQA